MTAYLIKSILCLLILWGFYKVALEQTAAHNFKRFYLLSSLILSLALPLITFSYTVEVAPQPVNTENFLAPTEFNDAPVVKPVAESTNWLLITSGIVYGAGVLIFGFRFLRNLLRLREKVRHNEHVKATSHINVLLVEKVIPHSFLKYIFLPKTDFKNNLLPAEVLQHEHAHVIQKHSWDILFIEFLQVVFWFNPILILLKKSVALNHEFLADQAALQQENNITNYTNLLFNYSGGAHHTALSSPINYSLTKKRILMLSKRSSFAKLAARAALILPVISFCVYFFSQGVVAQSAVKEPTSILGNWVERKSEFAQLKIYKEGRQLWMKSHKDTFKLRKEGNNQYALIRENSTLSLENQRLSLSYKPENNELFINDNRFIRPENTYRKLFAGDWEGTDVNQNFYIRSSNGNTSWVVEDDNGTNNYYPVLTSEGFYFTYSGTDIYYTVDRNIITSSDGHQYKKVLEAPKTLQLYIVNNKVSVNGYQTSLDNFKTTVDKITKSWSPQDFKNYQLNVIAAPNMSDFIESLNDSFKETQLFSKNASKEIKSQK